MPEEEKKDQSEINRELYSKINCLNQEIIGLQERHAAHRKITSQIVEVVGMEKSAILEQGKILKNVLRYTTIASILAFLASVITLIGIFVLQ